MTPGRAVVVAVSDSEQQRETLLIMLDADFAVTAIPTSSMPVGDVEPSAVVLAAGTEGEAAVWSEAALEQALLRWPESGLVLVDAPELVAARVPSAARASWTDPFSVPAAVSRVAATPPRLPAGAALIEAVHSADTALRPNLETAQVLAALVRSLARHASSEIASRFLGEQVRELVDRLAWVDWFDEAPTAAAQEERREATCDLTRSLQTAVRERELRARCRGLDFDFQRLQPCALAGSPGQVTVLARSLRAALLELPPGRVEVDADAGGLHCRHAALPPASRSAFTLDVVAALLRRVDARLSRREGHLSIIAEEARRDIHR